MHIYKKVKDVPSAYWIFAIDVVAHFHLVVHPCVLEDDLAEIWPKYKHEYKSYQQKLKEKVRQTSEAAHVPGSHLQKLFLKIDFNPDEIFAAVIKFTRTLRLYTRERPQKINSSWTDIDLWQDLSDNGF